MNIGLTISNEVGAVTHRVELPHDTLVRDCLQILPARVGRPLAHENGSPLDYRVFFNNASLNPDETLSQAGVRDGDTVSLRLCATAGPHFHVNILRMEGVTVTITNDVGLATHRVDLPNDVPLSELLVVLVWRLDFPWLQEDGSTIGYQMYRNNVELKQDETLSQASVLDGDTLSLVQISSNNEEN